MIEALLSDEFLFTFREDVVVFDSLNEDGLCDGIVDLNELSFKEGFSELVDFNDEDFEATGLVDGFTFSNSLETELSYLTVFTFLELSI